MGRVRSGPGWRAGGGGGRERSHGVDAGKRLKSLWAAAAAAVALGTASAGHAQEIYYADGLTETEGADVVAWNVLYWQRVDQGGGAPGEGFTFSNPAMNAHLFNPVRAARPTLEAVGAVPVGLCDRMHEVGGAPGWEGEAAAQARAAMKDLMLFGQVTTNVAEDPWGSWEHLMLILAAPEDSGVLVWDENGQLISVDLPLEEINTEAANASLKLEVSPESQQILGTLISAGGYWAASAQSGDVPQWQALITGELSKAERFRGLVDAYLTLVEAEGASTQVIHASFGLFGELPVIGVRLSDCYVLLDPTNGNFSGPFEPESPLDARGLLSFHSDAYEAGKAVRYYGELGCVTLVAAQWRNYPPPNYCSPVPAGGCWTPFPPFPPTMPMPWWWCKSDGTGTTSCVCTFGDIARDPAGRVVFIQRRCECTSCGAFSPTGPPYGPSPVAPWTPPALPAAPGTGCTCTTRWFW